LDGESENGNEVNESGTENENGNEVNEIENGMDVFEAQVNENETGTGTGTENEMVVFAGQVNENESESEIWKEVNGSENETLRAFAGVVVNAISIESEIWKEMNGTRQGNGSVRPTCVAILNEMTIEKGGYLQNESESENGSDFDCCCAEYWTTLEHDEGITSEKNGVAAEGPTAEIWGGNSFEEEEKAKPKELTTQKRKNS
jgi:hypothetical protein